MLIDVYPSLFSSKLRSLEESREKDGLGVWKGGGLADRIVERCRMWAPLVLVKVSKGDHEEFWRCRISIRLATGINDPVRARMSEGNLLAEE